MNATGLVPRLLLGFFAAALAVVFFHQGAITFMNGLGWVPNPAMRQTPVPPYGVPAVWNSAFWGGLWGVLFALIEPRLRFVPLLLAAVVFCATVPFIGAWIVVPLIKSTPMFAGGSTAAMARQICIYAVWGVGFAVFWTAIPRLLAGSRATA